MSKLKTLSEIECEGVLGKKRDMIAYSEDLRKEAIRWVKKAEKDTLIPQFCPDKVLYGKHCCDEAIVNFIKKFFNITEDEVFEPSNKRGLTHLLNPNRLRD
jgi:hypothetical protein